MRLLVFLLAALLASVSAPLARRLAIWLGAEDQPGPARKVHDRRMPRLGGLAIALATGVAVLAVIGLGAPGGERILDLPRPIVGLALAGLAIAVVGLVDDIVSLPPWLKLAGETIAALVAWEAGFRLETIELGAWTIPLGWLALPVTIAWFVTLMNALNLIDGLDGLAASQALIALAVLATQALWHGGPLAGTIALALAGALAGFLVHNVYPARQFMGTCGSLLIGLLLAALATGTLRGRVGMNLVLPLLAFGVPLLDTALAVVRRVARGRSPLAADREHLHHRLLDRGYSQRGAVAVLAAVQVGFGLLAASTLLLDGGWKLAPVVPAGLLALGVSGWLGYLPLARAGTGRQARTL
jgi:UDP-GlcNAc:undecaprenyl-phosphate GlcNAc-1-phosphate transferase